MAVLASILLIDDDRAFTDHIVRLLVSAGHTAVVEGQGAQALEVLHNNPFHLLILDIMLPDVSGFEVCRRIRRDANLFTLPIVMVSSMSSDEEVMHGLAQGADDYIVKPCDPQILLQRVNALLRVTSEDNTTDDLTNLPSGAHTKREIQRRMATTEPFALAYFELLAIREFAYKAGPEARYKAIRHLGRALQKVGASIYGSEPFVGHMGGGHFVCLVPATEAKSFGEKLRKAWLHHLKDFYESIDSAAAYAEAQGDPAGSLLDVLCCITRRDPKNPVPPQVMFETVSQIRQRALAARNPGVYLDQREFHKD